MARLSHHPRSDARRHCSGCIPGCTPVDPRIAKNFECLQKKGEFCNKNHGADPDSDEDDDMLSAMARELVERNGIGESADAVWKTLNAEHQKLFPTTSKSNGDLSEFEMPGDLLAVHSDNPDLREAEIDRSSILVFGQRHGSPGGRRSRARAAVPEQASLFS